jgi:hypothetical protein
MWTGRTQRRNSFGVFEPNKPMEVPEHIGQELRTVKLFVEVTKEGTMTPDSLDQLVAVTPIVDDLLSEVHKLQDQNADLQLKLATMLGTSTPQRSMEQTEQTKTDPEAVAASANADFDEPGYEPVQ